MRNRLMALVAFAACAAVMISIASGAAEKGSAKPAFNKMDADKDTKLTLTEFDAYVASYPELGITRAVFQKWDRDSDGTVTLEEYEVCKPMEGKAAPAKSGMKGTKATE